MSTLTVGSGKMYTRLSDAIAASKDGDLIQVQAGTYYDDTATINTKITIQGVGGMAHLQATRPIANGKGILVTNTDVTLDHIEFSGATVADANGAGVRYQGGNLTIRNSHFHDNQNGILANPSATGSIAIDSSEFAHNGSGTGYTHGIYIGAVGKLTVTNSYFHDTDVGHHIKSRALSTVVEGNRIVDGDGGTASYSIDVPNGGATTIRGNTIVQSATSQNPTIIAYGEEGSLHGTSSLTVTGNTIENFMSGGTGIWNATGVGATVTGNSTYNLKTLLSGPGTPSGTTTLTQPVSLDTSSPWQAASVNHPPVAGNDTATTTAGKAVAVSVLGNDTDADGHTLTVTGLAGTAQHGSAVVNANGTITYTPATGYTGTDAFGYKISDGHGGTATGAVGITVQPLAAAGTASVTVNASGTAANGVNAHFNVLIDGKKIGEGLAGTTAKDYTFSTSVTPDTAHKVQVQYDNDTNGRDLYVNKVTINGKAVLPTASNVTYDKGALDGRDVVAGQQGLWWNGTLVVNADKSYFPAAAKAAAAAAADPGALYQHLLGQNAPAGGFETSVLDHHTAHTATLMDAAHHDSAPLDIGSHDLAF